MKRIPWSLYLWASSVRCGMLSRQGPHHVAQNSTTYVLPGSNFSNLSPLTQLETASGGAGSPRLRTSPALATEKNARQAAITIPRVHMIGLLFFLCRAAAWFWTGYSPPDSCPKFNPKILLLRSSFNGVGTCGTQAVSCRTSRFLKCDKWTSWRFGGNALAYFESWPAGANVPGAAMPPPIRPEGTWRPQFWRGILVA